MGSRYKKLRRESSNDRYCYCGSIARRVVQLIVIRIASRLLVPIRIVRDSMCLFALFAITCSFLHCRSDDLHRSRLHVTISISHMPMLTGAYCPCLADFDGESTSMIAIAVVCWNFGFGLF